MSGGAVIERAAPVELRMAGRTLSRRSAPLRGAVGGPGRDCSRPGAFAPIGEVSLNLQHDRERVIA